MLRFYFCTLCLWMAYAYPAWAQARLTPNKTKLEMGQVQWKHPVSIEYSITNTGTAPLVMTNVTTSCACTEAEWTKEAIAPGGTGWVTAVFTPDLMGHFEKTIGIYSNAEPHMQYLYFSGQAVQTVTDFTKTHPYKFDNLMVNTDTLDFPDVHRGDQPTISMNIVNRSDTAYEPMLMHLPSYVSMKVTPRVLHKDDEGLIELTLDADKLPDFGLTQASVYLSRFAGDRVCEENEIPLTAVLLPDRGWDGRANHSKPPVLTLSETQIDMSKQPIHKGISKYTLIVTNTGQSPLDIAKVQVFNPAVGVDLKKSILKPGQKTKLIVTLDHSKLKNRRRLRILMLTNAPDQSKLVLNVHT